MAAASRDSRHMAIGVKRIYEPAAATDGTRILVDRLWPRGLKKDVARVDVWLKDIAPSTALRQWFRHDPARWTEFRARYFAELAARSEPVAQLRQMSRRGPVTLLYAARDECHNHAVALREFLRERPSADTRFSPG